MTSQNQQWGDEMHRIMGLSDLELARELVHARNARDAYADGRVPDGVRVRLARLLHEQSQRRTLRRLERGAVQ